MWTARPRRNTLGLTAALALALTACADSSEPPVDAGIEEGESDAAEPALDATSEPGTDATTDASTLDAAAIDASAPPCADSQRGGDETDVDCGGSCPPCAAERACLVAADCESRVCRGRVCQAASCFDGVQNAGETDVDCGGSCGACVRPDAPTFGDDLAESTRFLYEGPQAIQVGVAPGVIDARRAAVLFGVVSDRAGTPLVGVEVTVVGHPEFGHTLSRAEGRYDLVVNGGGPLALDFALAGYLPAQRTVDVPWRRFATADDVVLVELDPAVTPIDFSAPIQVAQGTPSTDEAGTRRATLLFRQGTTATMELADGTTQVLPSISARATEYTVGPNGPTAMPAKLPPTSAYTYAVELSVDEAIAAGARRVLFDRPVSLYVENFLQFPVGTAVPAGYYDRERSAWVASDDGRVVSVLRVTNGAAVLDVDGQGRAATTRELQDLGITRDELVSLASLYAPGAELWRTPVSHFTTWDCNWPYGPPEDAEPPDPEVEEDDEDCDPCQESGSIVDCHNLALGESIPVDGTPFALHYTSDRVPGRVAANALNLRVTKETMPTSLRRVLVEVIVAGRKFTYEVPAIADQIFPFLWDGLDAYGRRPTGRVPATVRLGYVYPVVYKEPQALRASFAAFGASFDGNLINVPGAQADRARKEVTFWRERVALVHGPDTRVMALGGWSLNQHHAYDPATATLYEGDGTLRKATSVLRVVRPVPGSDVWAHDISAGGQCGQYHYDLTIGPDGSIYVSECYPRVLRIFPDGSSVIVAGTGIEGFSGDGGPAVDAELGDIWSLALGPDGSLYIGTAQRVNSESPRIRRVRPDGIIETIAGTDAAGTAGDGGLAVDAQLVWPNALVVGPDGTIYLGDADRVRKIGPEGIITTLGGDDQVAETGDGGPASAAQFSDVNELLLEPDGSLLVSASHGSGRVRRITPDGIVHAVAGSSGPFQSGVPATEVGTIAAKGIARDPDGRLFISTETYQMLLMVDTDGYLTQVAGFGREQGDNVPLASFGADQYTFEDIAIGPSGDLYFINDHRALKVVTLALPGFTTGELAIPSASGAELFVFDHRGRHRRTLDAFTGALRLGFSYDADGRLVGVTDRDGNVTRVERGATGEATAIVAPGGQRTALAISSDGFLASVTDPAGHRTSLGYSPDGLLTALTEPGGGVHHFSYDDAGRLTRDEGPDGHWKSLSRSYYRRTTTVTLTTSGGRTTQFVSAQLPDGTARRTRLDPAGLTSITEARVDGTTHTTEPDGTTVVERVKADPRFGMAAPYVGARTITTPSGLVQSTEKTRTVTPPVLLSPFDLETWEEATTENGGAPARLTFDAAARTFTRTSPEGRAEVTHLDGLSRPDAVAAPGVAASRLTYGPSGLLAAVTRGTGAGARTTSWTYDGARRPTAIAGADGRTTELVYADASLRASALVLPGGGTLAYGFDADGNPVSITPPGGGVHRYTYTPAGLVASYTPPLVGSAADTTTYALGRDREPTSILLADGRGSTFGYDPAGRVVTESFSRGVLAYTYAASGLFASIQAPEEGLAFEYDGSLPTRTTFSGAVAGSVAVAYGASLRPRTESVGAGTDVSFTYDAEGLVLGAGSLSVVRGPEHGLVTSTSLGAVVTEHTYDELGELSAYVARAGATLASWRYERDPAGRLTSVTESIEGEPETTFEYDRDAAGRLTTVRRNGAVEALATYDARGNRTALVEGATSRVATYDAQDRLLSLGDATYTFSRSGHLAARTDGRGTTTFAYDEHGNLIDVVRPGLPAIHYVVDGQDRRVGKMVDGQLVSGYLYRGLAPVAEVDASGVVVARFVYGVSATVPDYLEKDGVRYRLVTDPVGSVRLVVDEHGTVVERLEYSAWGEVLSDSSPGFQPFGFAGGLYDPDTKLVHFWARDYDPAAGRWTARDPLAFNGGSTNLYAYVRNDPVDYRDPEGLSPADVQKIIDAARARTAQMTKEGQRMDPGWLNNMSSALPMLDDALGCPLGLCGKMKSGCKEQSEEVQNALNDQMADGRLQTDAKWTVDQKFVPVHYYLEARSSDPRDPVLLLDPWRNTFKVKK